MLWKMKCFTLQSMGRTNHKFPVYATTECSNTCETNYFGWLQIAVSRDSIYLQVTISMGIIGHGGQHLNPALED